MGNNGSAPSPEAATSERKVPLASPLLLESELREAMDAYRSGWLCMGPRTAELEDSMCSYTGAGHAVAVSSCSAALHIACLAAGLGPGDTAIVPSLAFAATVNAVAVTGAVPRFAEVAAVERPWLSAEAAEAAIEPSTKAIVAMSYGGHPGEVAELAALAEQHGLALIEDAAHASGSWQDGRHVGTFGLAGALSFSASKNLGIGEGGMLLTDDAEVAGRARSLRWHGISASTWERRRAAAPEYTVEDVGLNYRIDDPRAALVNARLRRLDEDNRRRAEVDAAYRAAFGDGEGLTPVASPPAGERASHCVFAIVLDEGIDRAAFRERLSARGVETSIHFPPLHDSSAYAGPAARLPLTEAFAARAVSLPIFPQMEVWQRELVIEAALEAAEPGREEIAGDAVARSPSAVAAG
ncbi:MAG TPA: DegT/DnrJ/EryC1/StrS family aminotransferase [Solirubrobacterales bacterium]